jgi:hypothetical protein
MCDEAKEQDRQRDDQRRREKNEAGVEEAVGQKLRVDG